MIKDFLEQITEVLLPERLGDVLQDNERYQAAISEENRLFGLLENSLNKAQKEILMEYFDAASDTEACVGDLAYRQGMKELLSLFRALSAGCGSEPAEQHLKNGEKRE